MPSSKPHTDIDELDEAIIALFQQDADQTNIEAARKLNVSEGTIRSRLNNLLENNIICFDVVLDTKVAGIDFGAHIKVSVQPAHVQGFLNHAENLPEIWYLARVTGEYDILAFIATASLEEAFQVINAELETLPGVNRLEVRPVAEHKKSRPMESTILGKID